MATHELGGRNRTLLTAAVVILLLTISAGGARAGNVYINAHPYDRYGFAPGDDNRVLDYLRGKDEPDEIPAYQYRIAVIGGGAGFWAWSDSNLQVQKPGYGTTTYYLAQNLTPAEWTTLLDNSDVLVILSADPWGDLSAAA
jgi:hypothetical protein